MGCWVAEFARAIAGPGHDPPVRRDDDGANWNFTRLRGPAR
jgi:hypothetical protein